MKLGIYSDWVWEFPHLKSFFPEYEELRLFEPCDAVATWGVPTVFWKGGWGVKLRGMKAARAAKKHNKPFVYLEEAFLRSYDLGINGAMPHGIIVDKVGMYYDARKPSELENIINEGVEPELVERAKGLIEEFKKHKLSKFNAGKREWRKPVDRPCVLVVDQCFGDLSIRYGDANKQSFIDMLKAARAENPKHHIIVKTHPYVISGRNLSSVKAAKEIEDISYVYDSINPHVMLEQVEKVYAVTSLLGFEALFHGLPVRTFGMPFYGGWGLTQDEKTCARRTVKRSLPELFAAAYIKYCRYVHPQTGKMCEIEDIMEVIKDDIEKASVTKKIA